MSEASDNRTRLLGASVGHTLPGVFRPGEPIPATLLGSEIVDFGAILDSEFVSGGGLVIDFKPNDGTAVMRIVIASNDVGMWIEAVGVKSE